MTSLPVTFNAINTDRRKHGNTFVVQGKINKHAWCCTTGVGPVVGPPGLVGGTVEYGAVVGSLIENWGHVTVRRRHPQLWIYLSSI